MKLTGETTNVKQTETFTAKCVCNLYGVQLVWLPGSRQLLKVFCSGIITVSWAWPHKFTNLVGLKN